MRYYYKLSEFYSFEEHDKDPSVPCVFPTLYEETTKIEEDYLNNDDSDWWLLERRMSYNDQAADFSNREEAFKELKEQIGNAIADYLYF